jgi:hypothetical protein
MNDENRNDSLEATPQVESDVSSTLKKIQQQLIFLEKKIDALITQSQAAAPREKYFSKPSRPFDRPYRHGKGGYEGNRAHRGPDQGPRFEKRHEGDERGYGHKNRPHDDPHGSGPGQERPFGKTHGGQRSEFRHKKKPFYYGRKDRG